MMNELQKIVLVLANGEEIKIPVGDILKGIATETYVRWTDNRKTSHR